MQINIAKVKEEVEKLLKTTQTKHSIDAIKNMNYEMAIGQSGKGSVFGSIFISVVWWPRTLKTEIQKLRLDEKFVSTIEKCQQRKFRKDIFDLINLLKDKLIFYQAIQLTARNISQNMNNMMIHYNLNELINRSVDKLCLTPFEKDFKVTHIFSKCFGNQQNQLSRIRLNLHEYHPIIQQIKVESKADGTQNLVNVANLVARAMNQNKLDEWKFKEETYFDEKFGSGGTSDPVTIKWLKESKHHIFGYPDIVRFSWSTVSKSLDETLIMTVQENHDDEKIFKGKNILSFDKNKKQQDLWDMPVLNRK